MKLLILKEVESVNNTIVIHQPNFLPRMKVFIKIAISDIWVIYDNVQYVRREWQNRVFHRDSEQRPVLFTAPIEKADYFEKINNIKLKDTRSLNEHLYKHFQCNYSKAPYNKWVLDYLELLIKETYNIFDLASYNVSCMNIAFDLLGFKPEEKYSSKMGIDSTDRNGKLIELCIKSNCTNYVCGSGGKTYIDEDVFKQAGINIIYYDYSKIIQGDTYGLKDYRNNSFLDFIAYNGPDALYNLIIEEKKEQIKQYM